MSVVHGLKRPMVAAGQSMAVVLLALVATGAAHAEQESKHAFSLDFPGAPQPKVEMNLSSGLFFDLFGIADQTLVGMLDVLKSPQAEEHNQEATKLTAETIEAVSQIIDVARDSMDSVQVRVYEGHPKADDSALASMAAHYEKELAKAGWDQVFRVKDGDESVRVSVRRREGAITNAFVQASNGRENVVALVRCDLSPENARRLGNTCMSSALDIGLGDAIAKGIEELQREIERELN